MGVSAHAQRKNMCSTVAAPQSSTAQPMFLAHPDGLCTAAERCASRAAQQPVAVGTYAMPTTVSLPRRHMPPPCTHLVAICAVPLPAGIMILVLEAHRDAVVLRDKVAAVLGQVSTGMRAATGSIAAKIYVGSAARQMWLSCGAHVLLAGAAAGHGRHACRPPLCLARTWHKQTAGSAQPCRHAHTWQAHRYLHTLTFTKQQHSSHLTGPQVLAQHIALLPLPLAAQELRGRWRGGDSLQPLRAAC